MNVAPAGNVETCDHHALGAGLRRERQPTENSPPARTSLAATFPIKPYCALERSNISDTRSLDSEVSIRVNPQKYTTNFGNGIITSHFDH